MHHMHVGGKVLEHTLLEKLKYNYWCMIKCTGFWNVGIDFITIPIIHCRSEKV